MYWPTVGGTLPAVVYFHGGGHVIGSLDTHDAIVRALCEGSGAVVASVDYRMGPEHRFPAAADDCFAALQWVHATAAELGIDAGRIAVAGDSAGGNLAAVVALMARDRDGPRLALQALIYPVTDYSLTADSYRRYSSGCGRLTPEAMRWFQGHYLRSVADAADWRASPLQAKLAGVAPAVVVTAEFDVLHDEAVAYAEALRAAGVAVDYRDFPGMIHGFLGMAPAVDAATEAQRYIAAALRKAFGS